MKFIKTASAFALLTLALHAFPQFAKAAEQAVTVDGDKVRFVEPGKKYVELIHGNVGVRWYAGFSDEHSFVKGASSPQFAIAMGLSAGHYTVKISEWEWPALPEAPVRTELPLK